MKHIILDSHLAEVIHETTQVLSQGGLVVFPTDTVYGFLVDATQTRAVEKLITFKNRTPGKAISVFVTDFKMMERLALLPPEKLPMLHKLLPGPFTMAFDSLHKTSSLLESEKGTIGLRLPAYAPVQALMNAYKKPITATSANLGGHHPHYSIESFMNQLPHAKSACIDLVVDAGKLPHHKPSTVIDLSQDDVQVLREGDRGLATEEVHHTKSPEETRELGAQLANRTIQSSSGKPVVFILQGDLGTGKTEMTRGIASVFGIEKVVSPTFVTSYEYEIVSYELGVKSYKLFVHCDLYNIQDSEEFEHLGLTDYLEKKSIMVIEWGERMGTLYKTFQEKSDLIFIKLEHVNESERRILVKR